MLSFSEFLAPYRGKAKKTVLGFRCSALIISFFLFLFNVIPPFSPFFDFYGYAIGVAALGVVAAVLSIALDVAHLILTHKRKSTSAINVYWDAIGEAILITLQGLSLGSSGQYYETATLTIFFIIWRSVLLLAAVAMKMEKEIEARVRRDLGVPLDADDDSKGSVRKTTSSEQAPQSGQQEPAPGYSMGDLEADFERERNMKFPVGLSASLWEQESRSKFPARQIRPETDATQTMPPN